MERLEALREREAASGAGFCVESFRSFSSSERMSTLERTRTCLTGGSDGRSALAS